MPELAFPILGLVAIIVLLAIVIITRYKVAGPNEAFIITGARGKELADSSGVMTQDLSGQRVVMGGRAFVVPFVQRLYILDLSSRRIPVTIRGAVSGQGVKLNLDGVALVKVGGNEDQIRAAGQRFLTQQEMIDAAIAFSSQPAARGRRLAVVTNTGGPGILAVD